MAFHENAIFPTNISKGSSGAPDFRHNAFEMDTGEQPAISRWPSERRRYNARYGIKKFADLRTVHDFYIARGGLSNGFRYYDLFDNSTATDHRSAPSALDINIGTGDGSRQIFQAIKTYTSFDQTATRVIEKPITGTVLVAVAGFTLTEGADYEIGYDTGEIGFSVAPLDGQQVTWGGRYHVPVKFAAEMEGAWDISIEAFEAGSTDVPLVEMLGNVTTPEQPWRGNGGTRTLTADTLYDYAWGHAVLFTPDADGHKLVLPYVADLNTGIPVFHFVNSHASFTIPVHNRETGALEFTINAAKARMVGIYDNAGSNAWIGLELG